MLASLIVSLLALGAEPTSAGGAGTAVRAHTAEIPAPGEVLIRLPTGRSQLGLTERDAVFLAPFDLTIGGPRLGWEHSEDLGGLRLSLTPSLGVDTSLKRGSLRTEAVASVERGAHQVSLELGLDARFLRPTRIGDELSRPLQFDRLQSHVLAAWDTRWTRATLRLPLLDRGRSVAWASASMAWAFTSDRVHLNAGMGLLLGQPTDRWTLGRYRWWFVTPYPEVELVFRL